MAGIDQCHEPSAVDVGVDLRRADVRMAEQRLQHAQVRPALEQVRGEGVTQDVWRDLLGIDGRARRKLAQKLEQPHARQIPLPRSTGEQVLAARRPQRKPARKRRARPAADRDHALLAALAGNRQKRRIARHRG
jgi:hypothetical protein